MTVTATTLQVGDKYHWKSQPERLVYLGARRFPGDSRPWYQFAKVDAPTVVWCEVLASDLQFFEETKE